MGEAIGKNTEETAAGLGTQQVSQEVKKSRAAARIPTPVDIKFPSEKKKDDSK